MGRLNKSPCFLKVVYNGRASIINPIDTLNECADVNLLRCQIRWERLRKQALGRDLSALRVYDVSIAGLWLLDTLPNICSLMIFLNGIICEKHETCTFCFLVASTSVEVSRVSIENTLKHHQALLITYNLPYAEYTAPLLPSRFSRKLYCTDTITTSLTDRKLGT